MDADNRTSLDIIATNNENQQHNIAATYDLQSQTSSAEHQQNIAATKFIEMDQETEVHEDNEDEENSESHKNIETLPSQKTQDSKMSDLLNKLTESASVLSSSSSSSCVNSSGIGSTDLSPGHIDYDLSRSPSSDTYNHKSQTHKRDSSVASQGSCGTARSSSLLDTKDGINFLLGSNTCGSSSSSSTSGKKSRNKEVIPQRKRRDFIPNELKDESYWERRRKNNLAAKRSREKRRLNDIVLETKVLELTNLNNAMKLKLDLCCKKYDISDDEVERLFDESKHLLVIQETLEMSELLTNEDSLTPDFENRSEDFISSIDSSNHHLTHSSSPSSSTKMVSDISCSISTSSSQHIGSSARSNSSCVDEGDCDGLNDAISESGLEIDENLDTIIESTDDSVKKERLINNQLDDDNDESSSPPSKRKNFFNPSHTSSCPSKSPSPTLMRTEDQIESLSPIDPYGMRHQKAMKTDKFNSAHFEADKMAFLNLNINNNRLKSDLNQNKKPESPSTQSTPMKSQYPLLYNQLCKTTVKKQVKSQQPQQPSEISASSVYSLEQQNQILLNKILSQQNNQNSSNPLMKTILNELALRNEFTKQNNTTPSQSNNISINSLLKLKTENNNSSTNNTSNNQNNDILTKILTSTMPSNNNQQPQSGAIIDCLGSLLKNSPVNAKQNQKSMQTSSNPNNNQANALMEKYKNLINKTNNNNQQLAQNNPTMTHHSRPNNNMLPKQPNQAPVPKNTVNNLLQSFNTDSKTTKNQSQSRKRHLNQQSEKSDQNDLTSLLTNNPDILNYVNNNKQQNQPSSENLNELVTMMLAAQQNTQNYQQSNNNNQQRATKAYTNTSQSAKNSNTAKNQTYNQLLMLHQNQKIQHQQQRQHEAAAAAILNRQSLQASEQMGHLSPGSQEQLAQLQSSQIYYQQQHQQAGFGKNQDQMNVGGQNGANNNANGGGDNMPLKLRFKMLQLKTGEVN